MYSTVGEKQKNLFKIKINGGIYSQKPDKQIISSTNQLGLKTERKEDWDIESRRPSSDSIKQDLIALLNRSQNQYTNTLEISTISNSINQNQLTHSNNPSPTNQNNGSLISPIFVNNGPNQLTTSGVNSNRVLRSGVGGGAFLKKQKLNKIE